MTTTQALIGYLQGRVPLNELPDVLHLDDRLWQAMDDLWRQSIVDIDRGIVVEWGALLEIRHGHLQLIKSRKGTAAGLRLIVPLTARFVGSFHTHPDPQGHTGIGFSGADFADMVNQGEHISLVQSGRDLFMLLRTNGTPAAASAQEWRAQMNQLFERAYRERRNILAASLIANRTISQELSLVFFYGRMFGQLVEVYRL